MVLRDEDGYWMKIRGSCYDFGSLVSAAERIIDRVADVIGEGRATVAIGSPKGGQIERLWSDSGRVMLLRRWLHDKIRYDVNGVPVEIFAGPVTLRVYIFGKGYCVLHPDGQITDPEGGDPRMISAVPTISIHGARNPPGSEEPYARLSIPDMQWVLSTIDGTPGVPKLARTIWTISRRPDGFNTHQFTRLIFPHDTYGSGSGTLRVKCYEQVPSNEPGTTTT
jgi:hypothetical protein